MKVAGIELRSLIRDVLLAGLAAGVGAAKALMDAGEFDLSVPVLTAVAYAAVRGALPVAAVYVKRVVTFVTSRIPS